MGASMIASTTRAPTSPTRCQIAADPAAKFIAGGTNLIDLMKYDVERPTRLIDITRLPLEDHRGDRGRRPAHRRARDRTAMSPTTRWWSSAIRCLRARSWPAPRSSCATWPRRAATSSSARAASTSTTPRRPCNKREPAASPTTHQTRTTRAICAQALAALEAVVEVERRRPGARIRSPSFHRLPGDTPADRHQLGPATSSLRWTSARARSRPARTI